jgi:23S rRNA pseudouridine2605 synthase
MCAVLKNRERTSKALNLVTLQRALSKLGFCSRSQAGLLIASGNVQVNAKLCADPEQWIDLVQDLITVDGRQLSRKKFCYVLFHKQAGIVTTRTDERGRKTIYDILDPSMRHLMPVGRLDKETSGMLLLTNDHQWAERMTNPKSHVRKLYDVQVDRPLTLQEEKSLRSGICIRNDGNDYVTLPATLTREGTLKYRIGLTEGKNRQVRKMFKAAGADIVSLKRIAIGSLKLGTLPSGHWRVLSEEETALSKQVESSGADAGISKRNY